VKVRAGYAEGLDIRTGVWLRRPGRVRGLAAACGGYLLLMLGSSLGLYLSDSGSGGNPLIAGAFLAAFGLPGLWALWRVVTAGLLIEDAVIVLRGPILTRRISPARALSFEPGVFGFVGNGTPGPVLKLSDGTAIGIWALGREGLASNFNQYREEALPLCERLNQLLEQVKGTSVPASHPPISSTH
jgi:hypothetical protein